MVDQQNMENKVQRDYTMPSINEATTNIRRHIIQATHFDIKLAIIQMIQKTVQFNRLAHEDPNQHIGNSLEICDTFKQTGIFDDVISHKLFLFSLKDKAKVWLNSLAPSTITTWEELAQNFLAKYFALAKMAKLHNDIMTFNQQENESLYVA